MPTKPYLLGIDQGTSGSRALILDQYGQALGYGYSPLPRFYPRPGWVEQDPDTLATGVSRAIAQAIAQVGCHPAEIAACGIACQRNTDFVWDARTGRPLANAITWQDLRTTSMLPKLEAWPLFNQSRYRLGNAPGPYSSALHLAWRMRHAPAVYQAAKDGYLRIGLSAAWLLVALGQPAAHEMDYSLVQAQGLYDFRGQCYWDEWLTMLDIPLAPLPATAPTVHPYGHLQIPAANGDTANIPVLAMIGNEQASLLGHNCYHPGDAACTHGTASFVKVLVGHDAPEQEKLNVYFAWSLPAITQSKIVHAYYLEADTTVSGAALRWMKEQARLLDSYDEVDSLAATVPNAGGVVFVPAFTGLNVPYNDATARGTILGLTLGSTRAHIVRAFLDSLGYQVRAILETISTETGVQIDQLQVGGGISASNAACQIQADLIGIPIVRPAFTETAARAAALLAGLGANIWSTLSNLPPMPNEYTIFEPRLSADERNAGYSRWQRAVERAGHWSEA